MPTYCDRLQGMEVELLIRQIEDELRRRLITQSELSRMSGINRQTISLVLKRRSKSINAIRAIRAALGLKEPNA